MLRVLAPHRPHPWCYIPFMRLLVILLLLLTPLQSVVALAFCLGVEQGTAVPCDSGMSEMTERDEDIHGAAAAPSDPEHLSTISSTDTLSGSGACGAVGPCSNTVPGVASRVTRALSERPTETGPLSSLPHLGPGIRPAPALDPPRA